MRLKKESWTLETEFQVLSRKKSLNSEVIDACSENVDPLEDTSLWLNYMPLTCFKVVTSSNKVVGN